MEVKAEMKVETKAARIKEVVSAKVEASLRLLKTVRSIDKNL
jgi:hypothetical protein